MEGVSSMERFHNLTAGAQGRIRANGGTTLTASRSAPISIAAVAVGRCLIP